MTAAATVGQDVFIARNGGLMLSRNRPRPLEPRSHA
jgi:hypothetical protein